MTARLRELVVDTERRSRESHRSQKERLGFRMTRQFEQKTRDLRRETKHILLVSLATKNEAVSRIVAYVVRLTDGASTAIRPQRS